MGEFVSTIILAQLGPSLVGSLVTMPAYSATAGIGSSLSVLQLFHLSVTALPKHHLAFVLNLSPFAKILWPQKRDFQIFQMEKHSE